MARLIMPSGLVSDDLEYLHLAIIITRIEPVSVMIDRFLKPEAVAATLLEGLCRGQHFR